MTPPSHAMIGLVLANTVYLGTRVSASADNKPGYIPLVSVAIMCSVMPDIDSVSRFFGSYGATNVFMGHRGITHSLLGVALIALLISLMVSSAQKIFRKLLPSKQSTVAEGYSNNSFLFLLLLGFFAGVFHLLCDLPSPSNVWYGIPMFFPVTKNGDFWRIGGWNKIGWFDYNIIYTLFIGVTISTCLIVLSLVTGRLRTFQKILFRVSLVLSCYLVISMSVYIQQSTYVSHRKEMQKQEAILNQKPPWFSKLVFFGHGVAARFFAI